MPLRIPSLSPFIDVSPPSWSESFPWLCFLPFSHLSLVFYPIDLSFLPLPYHLPPKEAACARWLQCHTKLCHTPTRAKAVRVQAYPLLRALHEKGPLKANLTPQTALAHLYFHCVFHTPITITLTVLHKSRLSFPTYPLRICSSYPSYPHSFQYPQPLSGCLADRTCSRSIWGRKGEKTGGSDVTRGRVKGQEPFLMYLSPELMLKNAHPQAEHGSRPLPVIHQWLLDTYWVLTVC